MKLHDDIRSDPPNDRDAAWELIPWYVNGTLSEEETRLVESHALKSDEFAEEIARQTALAERVAKTDPFDVPLERSWEHLRAQVEGDIQARTPAQPSSRGWFGAFQGRGLVAFGGAMAACIALVVTVQFGGVPGGNDFVTLTSDPGSEAPIVQFQAAEGLDAAALAERLADLGVAGVTGPSDAGVFVATLDAEADAGAVAQAMMALDVVLYAAPEANQ